MNTLAYWLPVLNINRLPVHSQLSSLPACPPVHSSIYPSIHQSTHPPSIHLPTYLSSIYLSIHSYVYPCIYHFLSQNTHLHFSFLSASGFFLFTFGTTLWAENCSVAMFQHNQDNSNSHNRPCRRRKLKPVFQCSFCKTQHNPLSTAVCTDCI